MRTRLASLYILTTTMFCTCSFLASADAEPNLWEMDLETLMTIQVGPSADASAKGLSSPYVGGEVAKGGRIGILGAQDIMDTPFSVTNYTQEFIQNHEAASVGDVLQYDPAVRVARGFGNFQQVYLVRGFPIFSDDMTYNGLYGILPRQYLAAELIERVEVLRGASAFLNGVAPAISGNTGGAVDVIPKRAPKKDLTEFTLGTQSDNQIYIATDLSKRSTDGSFGVRLNAVDSDGDTAVNGESHGLTMATLGTDYRGSKLRISADLGYQDLNLNVTQPNITIASGIPILKVPDAGKSIAQPWTYSNEKDVFGTLRAEYDFTNDFTGWIAAGLRNSKENSVLSAFLTANDAGGNYSANRFDVIHKDSVTTEEIGLRTQFQTLETLHTLTLSANHYQNDSRNAYIIFAPFTDNIYDATNVTSPTLMQFVGGDFNHPLVTLTTVTRSYALADEIAMLDKTFLLTLGVRNQNIGEYSYRYDTGAQQSRYDESRITPLAAAIYKLSPQYSLYTNYSEGLLKGDIAPENNNSGAVTNGGEALKPYQAKQVEMGIKYDGRSLGASVGLFRIRKPLTGFNNDNTFTTLDHQINQGLELSVYGEASPELKVLGGVSFLDTDRSGKNLIGAPDTQSNLGLEWSFSQVPGLFVNTHIMHTGAQFADANNTQKVPAWNRLDLGARYVTKIWDSHSLTVRASIENLTDNDYWASVGGFPGSNYLTIGSPRTILLFVTVNF